MLESRQQIIRNDTSNTDQILLNHIPDTSGCLGVNEDRLPVMRTTSEDLLNKVRLSHKRAAHYEHERRRVEKKCLQRVLVMCSVAKVRRSIDGNDCPYECGHIKCSQVLREGGVGNCILLLASKRTHGICIHCEELRLQGG